MNKINEMILPELVNDLGEMNCGMLHFIFYIIGMKDSDKRAGLHTSVSLFESSLPTLDPEHHCRVVLVHLGRYEFWGNC